MDDQVTLQAKLSLDTSEAEGQLDRLSAKQPKKQSVSLPKDTQIELPKETTEQIRGLFSGDSGLKNVSKILRGSTQGIQGLTGAFSGLSSATASLTAALGIVAAIVMVIYKLLEGTDTMEMIKESLSRVMDMLREGLAPALAMIGEIVVTVVDLLEPFAPLIANLGKSLATALAPVLELLKAFKPFVEAVASFLNELFSIFGVAIDTSGMVSTTGTKQAGGYKSSLDVWQTSGESDKKISEGVSKISVNVGKTTELVQTISGQMEEVSATLDSITEPLSDFGKDEKAYKEAVESGVKDAIPPKSFWQRVQDTWSNLTDYFKHPKQYKAEHEIKDETPNWLVNEIEETKGAVKGIWDNVVDGTVGLGEEIYDNILTPTGHFFRDKVWGGIKGLFGFADGGTLDLGAQVWKMNEKGNPEFVFNAGGHDTVINKEILSDALYEAIVRADRSTGKQELQVKVASGTPSGPRELAQWLLPSLRFLIARGG